MTHLQAADLAQGLAPEQALLARNPPQQTRLTDVVSLVEHIESEWLGLRDLALTPRHLGREIVRSHRAHAFKHRFL